LIDVILTGSTKGLGKSILNIIQNDFLMHLPIRSDRYSSESINQVVYNCDLSSIENTGRFVEELKKNLLINKSKEIIFINNAATISPISEIENIKLEDAVNSFNVNFFSPMIILKMLVTLSKKSDIKLKVINISSGVVNSPVANWGIYSSSKSSIKILFDTLIKENQNSKILVKSIDPGVMKTDMQLEIKYHDSITNKQKNHLINYQDTIQNNPNVIAMILSKKLIYNWDESIEFNLTKLAKGNI
jgi:NAD(P)-dependent dehydrogenase (short-subunit alcohol dehydrogenase family)